MIATASTPAGRPTGDAIQQAPRPRCTTPSPIAVVADATPARQAGLATFYGAAMAIMFVFFATQYGALAILADRQVGTLNRLLAAPISPGVDPARAPRSPSFVLGLVVDDGAHRRDDAAGAANWGPPPLVAILVVAAVVAGDGHLDARRVPCPDAAAGGRAQRDRRALDGGDRRRVHPAQPGTGSRSSRYPRSRPMPGSCAGSTPLPTRAPGSPTSCRRSRCSLAMGVVTGGHRPRPGAPERWWRR